MLAAMLHGATDLRAKERPEPPLAPGAGNTTMRVASDTIMRVASDTTMRVASDTTMRVASDTIMRVASDDALARKATGGGFEAAGTAGSVVSALVRPGGRIVQPGRLPPGLGPMAINLVMTRDRPSRLVPFPRRVRSRGGRPGERADRRVAQAAGPFSPRQGLRRVRECGRLGAGDRGAPRRRPGAGPE